MARASSSGWSSALAAGADTVVAVATAPGRGALAVVRVSGPDAVAVVRSTCPELDGERPWRAQLVTLRDGETRLDEAVCIPYRAPRSYTGEEMVELLVHASPYLLRRVVQLLEEAGARPARPGEFTLRAVANGKMDVVQGEAVQAMIEAESRLAFQAAQRQRLGELSGRYRQLRSGLAALLARLEALLDFEASHRLEVPRGELEAELDACRAVIGELVSAVERGRLAVEGARVVLTGPPNAGKSTLFNRLLRRERAIVAAGPGTTRDTLESAVELQGVRLILTDTAGLGPARDEVEAEGMARTRAALAAASVVVVLSPGPAELDRGTVVPEGVEIIPVRSKADLGGRDDGRLAVSAVTGEGVGELEERVVAAVRGRVGEDDGQVTVTARHGRALRQAAEELDACDLGQPELAAESVRWAVRAVDELVGGVSSEQVLDEIFARFCLGK